MSGLVVKQPLSSQSPIVSGTIGVLLVSANDDMRHNLAAKLRSTRWDVQEALSGASALEKIHDGAFSLVLLDPALTDLNVEDFREILETSYPGIEIIPINSRTGQLMLPSPSPGSPCFDLVREVERGGPFNLKTHVLRPRRRPTRGGITACLVLLGPLRLPSAFARWFDWSRNMTPQC